MNLAHDSIRAAAPVATAVPSAATAPRTLGEYVLAACDRDPDAAEVVAIRLRSRLLVHIEKALGEAVQDAEDVLDTLFLEMLDGGVTIEDVTTPVTCLMRVARRRARSHLAEHRASEVSEEEEEA